MGDHGWWHLECGSRVAWSFPGKSNARESGPAVPFCGYCNSTPRAPQIVEGDAVFETVQRLGGREMVRVLIWGGR